MSTNTRKDTGPLPDAAPPARSRRGMGAAWIFLGLVVVLAVAMLAFFLPGGVREPDAALERPDGVLLDTESELGNGD